jgi:ubiquinone/menaquinone biosynthesis C-methylase UbiE
MAEVKDYYEEGEEKFGFISSRLYVLSALIPTFRHFHRFVIDDLKEHEFKTILDIGSGNGKILNTLAVEKKDFTGTGLDPSPSMRKVSSKKASGKKVNQRIKYIGGSCRELPENEKYDLIYTSLSFHHWKDRVQCIPGIMDHLNEGGSFNIYEMVNDDSFKKKMASSHLMRASQFKEIGKDLGLNLTLREEKEFIRATFKRQ